MSNEVLDIIQEHTDSKGAFNLLCVPPVPEAWRQVCQEWRSRFPKVEMMTAHMGHRDLHLNDSHDDNDVAQCRPFLLLVEVWNSKQPLREKR